MQIRLPFVLAALALAVPMEPLEAQEEIGKKRKETTGPEWATLETASYSVQYEKVIPTGTVKRVVDEVQEALEQYIAVFKFKPEEKFKVKVLDSLNTYEHEGGDPSHPGHFNPRTGFLVVRQMEFYRLIPTVFHEALHQYLQAYVGKGTGIPIWFNEGLATYFEGIQRDAKSKRLDYKIIDNRKIRRMQEALFTRSALALEKLVNLTPEEFHDKEKEELHYSQSFAFVYFLMRGMGGKPVFQYAEALKNTQDVEKASEKIFGAKKKNLKKIEAAWKQYILGLKIEEPPAPKVAR